jgi:hypothetical protein
MTFFHSASAAMDPVQYPDTALPTNVAVFLSHPNVMNACVAASDNRNMGPLLISRVGDVKDWLWGGGGVGVGVG